MAIRAQNEKVPFAAIVTRLKKSLTARAIGRVPPCFFDSMALKIVPIRARRLLQQYVGPKPSRIAGLLRGSQSI
jgi:hypothetical protein